MHVQWQYREGILNEADAEVRSSLLQASEDTKTGLSTNLRLSSVEENNGVIPINPDQDSLYSESFGGNRTDISSLNCTEELSTPWSRLDVGASSEEWGRFSRWYSPSSGYFICPSPQVVDVEMIPSVRIEVVENGLENLHHSSPLSVLVCS